MRHLPLLLTHFQQYLQALGYQPGTCQMAPACVQEFLDFVSLPLPALNRQALSDYAQYLQKRPHRRKNTPLSQAYIAHHFYSLRLFFGWLVATGHLWASPVAPCQRSPLPPKPRLILTLPEARVLYESLATPLDKVAFGLFYGCGLRRSEAMALQTQHIDTAQGWLHIRKGKGQKPRKVPLGRQIKADLADYLTHKAPKTPVLPYQGDYWNKRLKKWLKDLGIDKALSLHSLRHSIASHLLLQGMALEEVRDFLGHACLESTQHYTHLSPAQLWNL